MKKKKCLFLSFRVPRPLNQGSNIRIYNEAKILSEKYDVDMLIVSEEAMTEGAKDALSFCKKVKHFKVDKKEKYLNCLKTLLLSDEPLQMNYFYNIEARDWVLHNTLEVTDYDFIFCHHLRMYKYVEDLGIPIVLDIVDASGDMYEKGSKYISGIWKWIYREEAHRVKIWETNAVNNCDLCIITSKVDARLLKNVPVVIPNGVKPELLETQNGEERNYIAFMGKMTTKPNEAAVAWFVDEILPKINHEYKFEVIGNPKNEKLEKRYKNNKRVKFVHESVYKHYKNAKVIVAPMLVSGGIQNKVLEAMALSKAVVTTPKCSEAIERIIPNSDDPEKFAKKVNLLLEKDESRNKFAKINREVIEQKFTWNIIGSKLIKVIEGELFAE